MERQSLKDYVFHKYGLQFQSSPDSTKRQRLGLNAHKIFAILSLENGQLAVKCPSFAQTVSSLPHIQPSELVDDPDWVEVTLSKVVDEDVKSLLDYAFKTATSGSNNFVAQQLIYLPKDDETSAYSAQLIPQRKAEPTQKENKNVPSLLQKMRESYDYMVLASDRRAYNFYKQGQIVANYEDDYDQIYELRCYYPDYHSMNLHQLRTYFTWRTQLRQKDFTVSSTAYVYVYLYELLNNIGVTSPEEGYKKLLEFQDKYADSYDQHMKDYLHQWLQDYVLYYGLDREKANAMFADKLAIDRDYHILRNPSDYSPDELTAVFAQKSSYLQKCRLYKNNPENWAKLVSSVWQHVYQTAPETFTKLIAKQTFSSGELFRGAIFYFHDKDDLREYVIDSERKYQFKKEKYYCQAWQPLKDQAKLLNAFFHEVDRLVRQEFHLGHPMKPRKIDPELLQLIKEGLADYQKQVTEERRAKVEIDLSGLDQIRTDASTTRDALLTDEEKQEEAKEETSVPEIIEEEEASAEETGGLAELNAEENFLLNALLQNQPYAPYLKEHHLMASIVVDAINERLFDEIGDAVIEFNDQDEPEIVEDYIPDIQELLEGRD